MKKAILIAFLVACVAIISCQPVERQTGAMPLTDEDRAAIKAIGPAIDKAALAGDWDAVLDAFTDDGAWMGPNSSVIQGHSAMMDYIISSGITVSEHMLQTTEVDGYGNLAYAIFTYEEVYSTKDSPKAISDKGNILAVLRKQPDSSWKIAIWSWNSDLPLPE